MGGLIMGLIRPLPLQVVVDDVDFSGYEGDIRYRTLRDLGFRFRAERTGNEKLRYDFASDFTPPGSWPTTVADIENLEDLLYFAWLRAGERTDAYELTFYDHEEQINGAKTKRARERSQHRLADDWELEWDTIPLELQVVMVLEATARSGHGH